MTSLVSDTVFVYQWHCEESDNITKIHVFGIDEENKNVYILINDFTPYIYLEIPESIKLNDFTEINLKNKIKEICGHNKFDIPVQIDLVYKKKLYYANKRKNEKEEYIDKLYPFLFIRFLSCNAINKFSYKIKNPIYFNGTKTQFKIHESNATPVLQLTSHLGISPTGWINIKGQPIEKDNKITYCPKEYTVSRKNIKSHVSDNIAKPLIMSFDIEVNSSNPNAMPNASIPEDEIFQISCIFGRQGDPPENYEKYLLTLGDPSHEIIGEDVNMYCYESEKDLLEGYTELIQEQNPNLIIGYNIFQFDIPYMLDRAKLRRCQGKFEQQSFIEGMRGSIKKISWSSSAYKNQEFQFLDCYGRLYVDALPIIRRDFNFDTYSLKNVSTIFLGQTKDPLTPKGIFKCYKLFTPKSLGVVGKYCIQDSVLVLKLFENLQMWIGLCEMSRICNTYIFSLYTQGQQIKIFSQVYKECMYKNYVVEKDGYVCKEGEQYTGAYVFEPIPGVYDMVVSYDFSSLYPSTIIAYNIDYTTLVRDESIPDEKCNIFDWEDHIGCEHDTVKRKTKIKKEKILCQKHRFRFLKEPKGIIPTLLENLLNSRKKINSDIKILKEKIKEEKDEDQTNTKSLINTLDKRQLAMKISANSMYGAFGVKKGYLPFMPGAMCTTARGRESIDKAAKHLQHHYSAKLIYGDTDSCYVNFPQFKTEKDAMNCYEFCKKVEEEMLTLFPRPMKLAYEEKIYWRFFILTKKRYMALQCNNKGDISNTIFKRGVLLNRRDSNKILRKIYTELMMKIFYKEDKTKTLNFINDEIQTLFTFFYDKKDFISTKSVGKLEDYKIRPLPTDEKKKQKRLLDLGCDEKSYHLKALPAHIQLVEKMKRRGKRVDAGTRIEYVITDKGGIKANLFEKMEDKEYFFENSEILRLDYFYYLNLFINPIDQAVETAFQIKDFVKNIYKLHVNKLKVVNEIKDIFRTKIIFE